MESSLWYGFLSKSSSLGGSVARARAAKVSIIIFTQSNCTADNGVIWVTADPMKTVNIATTLTVN